MAVTYWNESVRRDMFQVCSPDGAGINSFKMFMAYKDVFMLRDNEMLECMKTCRQIGALAQVSKIAISDFKGPGLRFTKLLYHTSENGRSRIVDY